MSVPYPFGTFAVAFSEATMKIALAADHAGLELKNHLKAHLESMKIEVLDLGAATPEPSDYPDFAQAVANAVLDQSAERGVLVCGSGVGASIAANKVRGIRAGLCHDSYSARQGVEHDDMNVLVLGARVIGPALAIDLVEGFLGATFSHEDRHLRRLRRVQRMDDRIDPR